ncbi:MAG: protein kinase domain-containing protein, partial [Bryobacteraceae bacterium]
VQEQQEFRRRFFIEAKAAGRLLHPGIVAVFDVGEDPDTSDPYIVMEYIEGSTLREVLASKDNKLPIDDALRIVQQVAEALDYAHTQGVVHRDIKPANILVTRDGQAKISDFGIAQLDLSHMTVPGRVLGTPAYMSPEQLEGDPVDGRSDLFSLGAILYTSVTGYRPFQGNSATTVCFKVANREPLQATALAPELPTELDAVIARALAKNTAERYQRGNDFAADLRKLRERQPSRKNTIWFSPPAAGQSRFESKSPPDSRPFGKRSIARKKRLANSAAELLHSLQGRFGAFGSLVPPFSSWQVQTAIGIPLFAAAVIVSLFAWREVRQQNRPSGSAQKTVAVDTSRASASADVQKADTDSTAVLQTAVSVPPNAASEDTGEAPAPLAGANPVLKTTAPKLSGGNSVPRASAKATPRASTKSEAPQSLVDSSPIAPNIVANAGALPVQSRLPARADNSGSSVNSRAALNVSSAAAPVADSNLEIHIESRFSDATLKVWVDETLAYEHPLHHKKRLLLLGGGARESVTIPVLAGKHVLRIQVRATSEQYDETKTAEGDFLTGGERILSISFDKHSKDMRVVLGTQ